MSDESSRTKAIVTIVGMMCGTALTALYINQGKDGNVMLIALALIVGGPKALEYIWGKITTP